MPPRRAPIRWSSWCCALVLWSPSAWVAVSAAEEPLTIDLQSSVWRGDLDEMIRHRAVRVLVPYSKTLYFVDLGGTQRGMSYEFMRAFEDALNQRLGRGDLRVHAVFIPVARDQLIPLLVAGKGDIAAANLTITPERSRLVDFAEPVANGVSEIIVTAPGVPPLHSLEDLSGREIYAERAMSYYDSLLALNERLRARGLAPVRLREADSHFETEDLLEMVNAGLVKIVVADSYLARFWRQIYPNLVPYEHLAVRSNGDIAFAVRKDCPKLKAELDAFTRTHRVGTLFGNVELQKYLQQTQWARSALSQSDLARFYSMVELFRKFGSQYDVDWLLMAAQGYQESQLDQTRRSDAGAIGVMQLTPATGREMGVGDISELEANIHAGIKYDRFLVDNYYHDARIDQLNKVLFGLAAYNAGPARIRSARNRAAQLHLDPNIWFDNVERVVAEDVGRQPVQYVSNIYKYFIAYTLVQEDVKRGLEDSGQVQREKPAVH
jgi:membrane-bound lytic murein transglycosylase MltF